MNSYETNNERISGTTSGTAPSNRPEDQKSPPTPGTAAAYVEQQAEDARKAIAQTMAELKGALMGGVDPRGWTKEHPWIAVGTAAAAGFVAAIAMVPTKDDQAIKRLKAIERALSIDPDRHHHAAAPAENGDSTASQDYARGKHSFMTSLGRELLSAVKPLILSTLTAGVTAAAAKTSPEEVQAHAQAANNPPPPSSPPEM